MVKYEIPLSKFSDIERKYIESLDKILYLKIQSAVNTIGECRNLGVKYDIFVDKKSDIIAEIESNAKISLPGSYQLLSIIKDALENFDLKEFKKRCSFKIIVEFSVYKNNQEVMSADNDAERQKATAQFSHQKPRYSFDQIILPEETKSEIFSALDVICSQDLIYNIWGFAEVDPIPRSILNFYGPPGTGKTMCAHAIAKHLNKPLLALNYSEIESKYVGDAAKNLVKAFNTAKEHDAVLFFDEADSFLGKRIENVSQGADQALNSLRSQMLILLEDYSGIVLFATNLVTNFDVAFESRILKHIKFELPNKEARAHIIRKCIPSKLPTDTYWTNEQMLEASEFIDGLSGREIKAAVLEMLLNKANKNGQPSIFVFNDLIVALKNKKQSIEKLKAEENERLKNKIIKKLKDKAEESKIEQEYNQEKGNVTNS